MKIVLRNYLGDKVEFKVDTKNMRFARYNDISGDEVLTVYYSDGSDERFDSDKHGRWMDNDNGEVVLFSANELELVNKLDDNSTFNRYFQLEELLAKHRKGGENGPKETK